MMKNYWLSNFSIILLVSLFLHVPFTAVAQEKANYRSGETDTYRRSSLCLMLVTHEDEQYAKAIEEQFKAMPLPNRYNSLNVDVRVISTRKSSFSSSKISSVLEDREVAKELVGKWFNRNYQGVMNMDRIHEWGGYNASFADLKRAQDSERGIALLSEEGSELIQNTFVLVCDISYYDRAKTGEWLSGLMAVGAAYLDVTAQQQARKGNTTNASTYSNLATAAAAGSEAAADIAGFSVNVNAHLFRLKWSNKLRDELYGKYWVDEETPAAEKQQRKSAFDNDHKSYELEYLGNYRSRSGRTVSKANNDLYYVIRQVCSDAVEKSINNLSKMFPVFKPKTPFYCDGDNVYAYIGTKEGVSSKSKYEVLETKKSDDGIKYNRVAQVTPRDIWDNANISMTDDGVEQKYKGTQFVRKSGKNDICDQGYLLREMGKLGYQYKRNQMFVGLGVGYGKISEETLKKKVKLYNFMKNPSYEYDCKSFNVDAGWLINYHTNFAWNPINVSMAFGDNLVYLAGNTGFVLRTSPLGKRGKWSFFVWPTAGVRLISATMTFKYFKEESKYYGKYRTKTLKSVSEKEYLDTDDLGIFDWNVRLGVNITEKISVSYLLNDHKGAINVGYAF